MAIILLVEDNEMNRDMLSRRLKRRVIGLTAHAMAADEQRAGEAGCDDFDTKPTDFPRLVEKIQKQLKGRAA